MKVGMLWFDNDPKADLDTKVKRAAAYYLGKYGRSASICYVHPSMVKANNENGTESGSVMMVERTEVRSSRSVLPNHFWIG